ncbi:acyl carrier protein [Rhodobacteraceae bacterium NNCM2]|nr:acyl carrier protein [Coraliihabitans acroporae]
MTMRDDSGAGVDLALRDEVAALIVEALVLDDVTPAEIDPDAPLFGDGLSLDSIDALELAFAIAQKYGFKLRSDDDRNREIFSSLNALTRHIAENRQS